MLSGSPSILRPGTNKQGRRPAVVLTPASYNRRLVSSSPVRSRLKSRATPSKSRFHGNFPCRVSLFPIRSGAPIGAQGGHLSFACSPSPPSPISSPSCPHCYRLDQGGQSDRSPPANASPAPQESRSAPLSAAPTLPVSRLPRRGARILGRVEGRWRPVQRTNSSRGSFQIASDTVPGRQGKRRNRSDAVPGFFSRLLPPMGTGWRHPCRLFVASGKERGGLSECRIMPVRRGSRGMTSSPRPERAPGEHVTPRPSGLGAGAGLEWVRSIRLLRVY